MSEKEKIRKRRFAFLCVGLALPLSLGFMVVDFIEGEPREAIINIISAATLISGLIALTSLNKDSWIYGVAMALMSLIFLYNISIGSGNGTAIFWIFSFPLLYVFFFGKKGGGLVSILFFLVLVILMINPFSFGIHPYAYDVSIRFLVSFLLVAILAYGLEASREKYEQMLTRKNASLLIEKENLQKAMGEIKTLSGLIPICSSCKKIRDDKGYWQQVEVYVRDHSSADFSHGICPDCARKLYPELKLPD